ncbi:trimeric intracellular cation channel family protein [Actinophytocola glycyrrhizae]|uniref:Trimeric intracellular cation channel family protein n=1 Tax=Actinophytocola glycyrrhizae TaxID=2044873 RepID=A0ABV9S2I1_9PSEU
MVLTAVLDYIGVATFAMVSTIAARDRRLDLVSAALLASVAGVGGGTLRDLLLERTVFWLHNPGYLYVCVGAATLVWFVGAGPRRRQALLFLDALGVSAFAVVGALIARESGVAAPVAVALGLPPVPAAIGGAAAGTVLRVLAITRRWQLPAPPRT